MSNLQIRNEELYYAIEAYPALVKSLISFITEPAVIKLLEAGGQTQGDLLFNVVKGQVVSFKPGLEMKIGYEIKG